MNSYDPIINKRTGWIGPFPQYAADLSPPSHTLRGPIPPICSKVGVESEQLQDNKFWQ